MDELEQVQRLQTDPLSVARRAGISCIPLEILEAILSISSLKAVSTFSQTCKAYYDLVYRPMDNHLWRTLFLNHGEYDDPRFALGQDAFVPWDTLLQEWTAVGKLLHTHAPRYTSEALRTLLQMVHHARPASQPLVFDSRNLQYLRSLLCSSGFFNRTIHDLGQEEGGSDLERINMLCRLKFYAGLEAVVSSPAQRLLARCTVYDLRNYHKGNSFGPFCPDGSGCVDWKHLYAIQEVIAMNMMDFAEGDHSGLPMTMKHIQTQTAPRCTSADPRDWAGIEGRWQVAFCFCDHRDLLAFNSRDGPHFGPVTSVFEDVTFEEALRLLEFELTLVDVEEDPTSTYLHPTSQPHPTLHFVGRVSGNARLRGQVSMTPDGQVRWSFVSGESGQAIWSTEAVQVGGVASAFGAIGVWTTVFHDLDDPVGPMWLWKFPDETRDR